MELSHLPPLSFPCAEVERRLSRWLAERDLRLVRSFDLEAARKAFPGAACPYHGTGPCTCHLSAFLIYDASQHLLMTLVVYGHDKYAAVGWAPLAPDEEAVEEVVGWVQSMARLTYTFQEVDDGY